MLHGSQKPRVLTRPAFASEASGLEAIELASSVGLELDPWQKLFVRVCLAERADGKYSAREVAELVSRQNGKGGGLEAVVLHGMFIARDPLTLWTAHQFKTSTEAFIRVKGWIDGSDALRRRVHSVNASHGEEGITLRPLEAGGPSVRLRFLARSKSSGRGFSPQRVIWDEAQELALVAFEAMRNAMRAQPNPQSVYAGTVPGEEVLHPEHWTRLRNRGRAGGSAAGRLAWMEWTPKGSDDPEKALKIDLDDPKVWADGNPGLGYRLDEEQLVADREELTDESFARECLSVWPTRPGEGGVVDDVAWAKRRNPSAKMPKRAAVYLDVSPDRAYASIGVAGPGRRGRVLVLAHRRPGTTWVIKRLKAILKKREIVAIGLHARSQGSLLRKDLTKADVDFTEFTYIDLGEAVAGFLRDVNERPWVEHVGQPELDSAVSNARTRFSNEVELWDRKDPEIDISPLVAVSGAKLLWDRWAAENDYDIEDSFL